MDSQLFRSCSEVYGFHMALSGTMRRRVTGGVILGLALAMLICGQTIWAGKMKPGWMLLYYIVCLGLTITAMFIAIRDVQALARETRAEQEELINETLREIPTKQSRKDNTNQ
jgi:hypothetical protein